MRGWCDCRVVRGSTVASWRWQPWSNAAGPEVGCLLFGPRMLASRYSPAAGMRWPQMVAIPLSWQSRNCQKTRASRGRITNDIARLKRVALARNFEGLPRTIHVKAIHSYHFAHNFISPTYAYCFRSHIMSFAAPALPLKAVVPARIASASRQCQRRAISQSSRAQLSRPSIASRKHQSQPSHSRVRRQTACNSINVSCRMLTIV